MNVIALQLEVREDRKTEEDRVDDLWLKERAGVDPDERRASWRRWLRKELERTLQWPGDQAARERLIGQCASEITVLARQLRGRGWLLDGAALAVHVRALLAPIAKAQRAGKVRDFWPYFCEAVSRYVGANAEEIQAHARRTGTDEAATSMASAMAALGLVKAAAKASSMTELLADRDAEIRREKLSEKTMERAQLSLL